MSSLQDLRLKPSAKSPQVDFSADSGVLEISGKSIPENSHKLYEPLLAWLDEYTRQPAATTELHFKLSYFNSSSAEYILEMMRKLESIHLRGKPVRALWFYEEDDEDMQLIGEDFQAMLKLPLSLVLIAPKEEY
ncbi:MAG: DUF1987 domain-containing protein [Catalinimonas sp.]